MLHKKARLLRQQYSALGPQNQMSHGGMNIKRQIDDVNRQTLQLEPLVKMKNPSYQPPRPGVSTPLKEANGQIRVGKAMHYYLTKPIQTSFGLWNKKFEFEKGSFHARKLSSYFLCGKYVCVSIQSDYCLKSFCIKINLGRRPLRNTLSEAFITSNARSPAYTISRG